MSERNRGAWTDAKSARLKTVLGVLKDLRTYWPLTLRQVYYQLVASGVIANNVGEYKKLSQLLSQARIDELLPWEALEDRARSMQSNTGFPNKETFIQASLEYFLSGYERDKLQNPPTRPEVWVEKDALSRVCGRAAEEYGVNVIVARGFSSVSFLHDCAKRAKACDNDGQSLHILYFGDMDPSGYEMLPAMLATLNEMHVSNVSSTRCALTTEQITAYALPHNPDALKWTDSRAKKYVSEFGELAVELDALRPDILEQLVRDSIEDVLDMTLYDAELQQEQQDKTELDAYKKKVKKLLGVK
jgi:hypothetical protein